MAEAQDPKLLDALQRIFATRDEVRSLIEYQRQLYASLEQLNTNHRAVHEHVRSLTDSHNRAQGNTGDLMRAKDVTNDLLRSLESSHRQTREDVRRAIDAITYIQQEVRKVERLEARIDKLERELQRVWQDDKQDDRKRDEQEQRLRKLERR